MEAGCRSTACSTHKPPVALTNRLRRLQGSCEIPLAASTQWDIVDAASWLIAPAYEELIRQAAQGEVVYNDDTTVRILELMGERARKTPPPDDEHDPKRTGLFTSGVVATRAGVRIALFFSGRQHAGENLSDVLQHRAAELAAPIQMCDGLARNLPGELDTILANCLAHGRRNFVELLDRFPDECRHVIESFKVIYHNDKVAREEALSAEARLAYHQTHSRQTMEDLQAWLQRQFDEKLVEPNSALGDAINSLLKRWHRFTLFLRQAGAPLDNNICERALKTVESDYPGLLPLFVERTADYSGNLCSAGVGGVASTYFSWRRIMSDRGNKVPSRANPAKRSDSRSCGVGCRTQHAARYSTQPLEF